jgi:hypothetical protein
MADILHRVRLRVQGIRPGKPEQRKPPLHFRRYEQNLFA